MQKNFKLAAIFAKGLYFTFQNLGSIYAALSTGSPDVVCDIRDNIALHFEAFKRMYENGLKIALNSTCSKGFK